MSTTTGVGTLSPAILPVDGRVVRSGTLDWTEQDESSCTGISTCPKAFSPDGVESDCIGGEALSLSDLGRRSRR
jgi:hypothetical protein